MKDELAEPCTISLPVKVCIIDNMNVFLYVTRSSQGQLQHAYCQEGPDYRHQVLQCVTLAPT